MTGLSLLINKLEEFAPVELSSEWDNSGWQVYLGEKEIKKVLLALSPTIDVVNQAVEQKCNLIISHHPLIFSKLHNININNHPAIIKAIQNDVQIYSAHTNLDSVLGGIADRVANLLNLKNLSILETTSEGAGFGRTGELEQEELLSEFIQRLKNKLGVEKIKLINPLGKEVIKKVAILPGSGGSFIPQLKDIDIYITGDIKYHEALEVKDFIAVDAGHFETEKPCLEILKEQLTIFDIEIILAEEKTPWEIK